MQTEVLAGVGVKAGGFGAVKGAEQGLEFGEVSGFPEVLGATALGGAIFDQDAAALGDGGAEGGLAQAVLVCGGEQHAGEAGVEGESGHALAGGSDVAGGVDGAEVAEELVGAGEGGGGWGLEPSHGVGAALSLAGGGFGLLEGEPGFGEIEAVDLGRLALGAVGVIPLGWPRQVPARRATTGAI